MLLSIVASGIPKLLCSKSNHVIYELESFGIKDITLEWFKSYLNSRTQRVEVNDCLSDLLSITCGVFQASILGPLLFLCYTNDIFKPFTHGLW